ncbi:hypothetical protein LXA43DRAFT_1097520 [Ganoderma leucocontextum]|nr:hypothetical protein LXA43DRAFT_1097520 [Ganoderma leucocontextum]
MQAPERYLSDTLSSAESLHLPDVMKRDHWSFGIGRRICLGVVLAEKEIFLGLAHMLWAFKRSGSTPRRLRALARAVRRPAQPARLERRAGPGLGQARALA